MVARPLISVVDDDESVRESLPDLLKEFGFDAQAFSSAEEFLASESVAATNCLLLDLAMPGMTGPDLRRELKLRERSIPIVFITAHRDATVRPRLTAEGAVDCLFKPFEPSDLLRALNTALGVSCAVSVCIDMTGAAPKSRQQPIVQVTNDLDTTVENLLYAAAR